MKIVNVTIGMSNIPTLDMNHERKTIFVRPNKDGSFNVYTAYKRGKTVYTRHPIEDIYDFKNKKSKEMQQHLLAETAIMAIIEYCENEDVCPPKGLYMKDDIFKTFVERCYRYIFDEDSPRI